MLHDGIGLLHRVFVKSAFQFQMNGALAAVGHNDGVELLARLIENDSLSPTKEYFPMPSGRRYDSILCQSKPDPLMVTEVAR